MQRVNAPQPQVQMDLYPLPDRRGRSGEAEVGAYLPGGRVGHLQIAGVPGATSPISAKSTTVTCSSASRCARLHRRHRRRIPAARWHLGGPGLVPTPERTRKEKDRWGHEATHHRRCRFRGSAPRAHAAGTRHAGGKEDRTAGAGRPVCAAARSVRRPRVSARTNAAGAMHGAGRRRFRRRVPPRPRRCRANASSISTSACAATSTARATCSTPSASTSPRGGKVPTFVFSSSVAVFGPDAAVPLPPLVADTALPAPQTSYGTHKLMCEYPIADCYTRKGLHRRPQRAPDDGDGAAWQAERRGLVPSSAASSASRWRAWNRSARCRRRCRIRWLRWAERGGLIAVYEASREAFRGARAQPAGAQRQGRRDAGSARAGGRQGGARACFERDERIAGIVANWPTGASRARRGAGSAGGQLVRGHHPPDYIADCEASPERRRGAGRGSPDEPA